MAATARGSGVRAGTIDDAGRGAVEPLGMALQLVHVRRAPREGTTIEPRDERRLAELAKAGDEDAFAELVRGPYRLRRGVSSTDARRHRGCPRRRPVTFLRVWENLPRYDPTFAFSTWVFRIAANLAIDALRARGTRARRWRRAPGRPGRAHDDRAGGAPACCSRRDPSVFHACSWVLSRSSGIVFVLRELEEKESREVAEIVGCRESTVRNHLFQARRLLRVESRRRFPRYIPRRAREPGRPERERPRLLPPGRPPREARRRPPLPVRGTPPRRAPRLLRRLRGARRSVAIPFSSSRVTRRGAHPTS